MTAVATSKTKTRRLRRARELPYLPFLLEYATAQTPLSELFGLSLKFIHAAVVLYHDVGPPCLLFLRELTRLYRAERRLVHAPLRGLGPGPRLGDDDGYRVIEVAAALTHEKERHVGHEEVGRGGNH